MVKERWRDSLWPPYLFGLLIGGLAVGVTLGLPMSAEHNAYRALRDSLATAQEAPDTVTFWKNGPARRPYGGPVFIVYRTGDSTLHVAHESRAARLARLREASRQSARIADSLTRGDEPTWEGR